MEVVCNAKIYMVIQKCDKCNEGIMERCDGHDFTVDPPVFTHRCNKCGHEEKYSIVYPYQKIQYEIPT